MSPGRALARRPSPQPPPRVGGDPPLEAVLFDAGLTLIHDTTPAADVAAEVFARRGIPCDADALAAAMATAMGSLDGRWHRGDWWLAESGVRRLFLDAYERGLRELPSLRGRRALRDDLATGIYESYLDATHWSLFPDVMPTLDALRAAGLRMSVISDWGHGLEGILLELELGAYFEFLLVSSRLGIAKPDPRIFELALDRLGVAPHAAVYVGDTYVKDVFGARAAGIAPVLLDRADVLPGMDCAVVRDLAELLSVVGLAGEDAAPAARP